MMHGHMNVKLQGGSNMTGTDLCVRLYKSVRVIFEPPCKMVLLHKGKEVCIAFS